jgi:hypothetical protein
MGAANTPSISHEEAGSLECAHGNDQGELGEEAAI